MHLKAKKPVLAPHEYWSEIEQLSKAALIDLVWDFATTATSELAEPSDDDVMKTLRERAAVIKNYRA